MNVLFLSDTRFTQTPFRDGSIRYRCYHMAEALQASGHLADVTALENLQLAHLTRYDVVSVHRPRVSKKLLSMLDRCRKLNIRTVADIDRMEFIPSLAADTPAANSKNCNISQLRASIMRRKLALQHFDEVSVATEELARLRRVQLPSQPVYVVPNGLSNYWLTSHNRLKPSIPDKQTIGYICGNSNADADFAVAADVVSEFIAKEKHTDESQERELMLVGPLRLDEEKINPARVTHSAWTDFMNMPSLLTKSWVQISPLKYSQYNLAKSHTSFIEAAAFGVPFIGSPTVELKEHSTMGLHVARDEQDWRDALHALLDKEYYATCQSRLYEYARDCCMAKQSANKLLAQWSKSAPESDVLDYETTTSLSATGE